MSVIVKGMKMPKNCLHCDFDDSYGICACRNEAPYVCEYSAKQRPSWCPLEDLPSAQEKRTEERTETHVCDCISRQAAIDALNKKKIYRPLDSDRWVISDCLNAIVNLPSAQPETHEERTETHACDLISRNDAIRIVDSIDTWQAGWRGNAIESLKAMPSAQPERKKGKWIINSDGYYPYCSECRKEPKSGDMTDFCPNCGADMTEGEE